MSAVEVGPGFLKRCYAIFPWLSLIAFLIGIFFFLVIYAESSYRVDRDGGFALKAMVFGAVGMGVGVVSGRPMTSSSRMARILRRRVLIPANLLLIVVTLSYCLRAQLRGPWI